MRDRYERGEPIHLYGYARDNPIRFHDRNGRDYSDSNEIITDLCEATEGDIEITVNSSSGEERVTSAAGNCKALPDGGPGAASLGKPVDMKLRTFKTRFVLNLACVGRKLRLSKNSPNTPKDPL